MRTIATAISIVALAAGLGACATVTRGTSTEFKVISSPDGAQVKTSTGFTCSPTPCSMKMPRKDAFDVTISKDGYAAQVVHVRSAVQGGGAAGFAGNLVAGSIVGMAVDGSDGAMDDLIPNPLTVTLAANPPAGTPAPTPVASAADTAKPKP